MIKLLGLFLLLVSVVDCSHTDFPLSVLKLKDCYYDIRNKFDSYSIKGFCPQMTDSLEEYDFYLSKIPHYKRDYDRKINFLRVIERDLMLEGKLHDCDGLDKYLDKLYSRPCHSS